MNDAPDHPPAAAVVPLSEADIGMLLRVDDYVTDPPSCRTTEKLVGLVIAELRALRLVADAAERAVKDAPNLYYLADALRIAGRMGGGR